MRITEEVLEVLQNSTCDSTLIKLPDGQLDRKLYVAVNKVLEGLGGKWNRKLKGHVFPDDVTEAFENAIETGEWVDLKKEFQFFQTPKEVVEKMVDMVSWREGMKVLEPSAGEGAIAFSLPNIGLHVGCIELNPKAVEAFAGKLPEGKNRYFISEGDFLELDAPCKPTHDVILMNPPFSKNQDIKHTMHALKFLKPGGELVAILSTGAINNSRKINEEFKQFREDNGAEVEFLEEGAFKSSGTGVRTVIMKIRKPQA